MMWCKDGREVVLTNVGMRLSVPPWPIVTTYVVCDKRWYLNEMSWWYFMLFWLLNELCLLFLPNPCAMSCFVLHICRMSFPSGIFMVFVGPLWDLLMRVDAFNLHSFRMRFPYGSSHAFFATYFAYEMSCSLGCYEISFWDVMVFWPWWDLKRFSYECSCVLTHPNEIS